MLANVLPLIASQPIAKAGAAVKGPPDGPSAGGDTFARELGLAQARGAAAPRPAAAQAPRPAPTPATPPAKPAAPPPAQARAATGIEGSDAPSSAAKEATKKPAAPAGSATTSSSAKPGSTTKATGGAQAPKDSAADAAEPATGSVAAASAPAADGATPAGDVASMIASLLGLDSPAPTGSPAAQAQGGQATDTKAPDADGTQNSAGALLAATATEGPPGSADARGKDALGKDKDAADPAAGSAEAAGLPSTADLASAGAAVAASSVGSAAPRPASVMADTMAPATVALPAAPATAPGMPQPLPGAVARPEGAAAAPFEAQLAAALGSPEFAPALGHQVSLLVRGGVQEARLHLNPAEMGPITVQIALDGQSAQINLAAEQPLTRQLLEQAMPALAGALREGGLTLTGGGVFEQPRDPRQGDTQASPNSPFGNADNAAGADSAQAMPAPSVRTLRGAVDLIA